MIAMEMIATLYALPPGRKGLPCGERLWNNARMRKDLPEIVPAGRK